MITNLGCIQRMKTIQFLRLVFFKDYFILIRATSQAAYQVATLDERDDSLDVEYWSKYPNVIDETRERQWDALLEGLQKY